MIINSLSMKNFQCYVGEHSENNFIFSKGVNYIIGNNGAGKSKLYDAFYWVLNDQLFNSDTRKFITTERYAERIISDNVTRSCSVGDTATCEVILYVTSSNEKEYRLTRVFHATKISDEPKWISEKSKLIIEEKKSLRWFPSSESADSVLQRVIPHHLKPYMWFQGEQVDGLMDLTDKQALTHIINLLSDIDKYDKLIQICSSGVDKAASELRVEQKKTTKNTALYEELSKKYNDKEQAIRKKKDEVVQLESTLQQAQIRVEELIGKIDDANRKTNLKSKKDQLEQQLKDAESRFDAIYKNITSQIFYKYWVLRGIEPSLSKFSEKFKEYIVQHQSRVNVMKGSTLRLPLNVPQPVHVQQMLDECRCFVCDRTAPIGSEAYENIKKHLEKNEANDKDVFVNDLSGFFQKLYDESLSFSKLIDNIPSSISEYFTKINNERSNIESIKQGIEEVNTQFEGLIEADNSEDIVKEFRVNSNYSELFSGRLATARSDLNRLEKELDELSSKLKSLVVGEIDSKYELTLNVFNILFSSSKEVREKVYRKIITDLESDANTIFSNMTKYNQSMTGKIALKILSDGTCRPEIADSQGYIISGMNDANIILIKLSLIVAILSSRSKWSENYTLISDAPTAKMAKEYTIGFYESLSSNFSQSIIMTYDYLDQLERVELINNTNINIGSIHTLTPTFGNNNREDRTEFRVKVEKVST